MATRTMAYVTFDGYDPDFEIDADGAAAALQKAGYAVHRLSENDRQHMEFPRDDHLEAVCDDRDEDDVWGEVRAIVVPFGGDCCECGPIGPEHTPFAGLFTDVEGFVP